MKFEAVVKKHYPHPPTRVWRALTSAEALSRWLMETPHFVPEVGYTFELHCETDDGQIDVYHCRVLELDPPRRMVWSWVLDGREKDGATRVSFELAETDSGCELVLRHSGDRDPETVERFKSGWPHKLDALGELL